MWGLFDYTHCDTCKASIKRNKAKVVKDYSDSGDWTNSNTYKTKYYCWICAPKYDVVKYNYHEVKDGGSKIVYARYKIIPEHLELVKDEEFV